MRLPILLAFVFMFLLPLAARADEPKTSDDVPVITVRATGMDAKQHLDSELLVTVASREQIGQVTAHLVLENAAREERARLMISSYWQKLGPVAGPEAEPQVKQGQPRETTYSRKALWHSSEIPARGLYVDVLGETERFQFLIADLRTPEPKLVRRYSLSEAEAVLKKAQTAEAKEIRRMHEEEVERFAFLFGTSPDSSAQRAAEAMRASGRPVLGRNMQAVADAVVKLCPPGTKAGVIVSTEMPHSGDIRARAEAVGNQYRFTPQSFGMARMSDGGLLIVFTNQP